MDAAPAGAHSVCTTPRPCRMHAGATRTQPSDSSSQTATNIVDCGPSYDTSAAVSRSSCSRSTAHRRLHCHHPTLLLVLLLLVYHSRTHVHFHQHVLMLLLLAHVHLMLQLPAHLLHVCVVPACPVLLVVVHGVLRVQLHGRLLHQTVIMPMSMHVPMPAPGVVAG